MVVIRRELPRTRLADWFEINLPQWHFDEDSPFRMPFGRFNAHASQAVVTAGTAITVPS
jgi:hypothetical protein